VRGNTHGLRGTGILPVKWGEHLAPPTGDGELPATFQFHGLAARATSVSRHGVLRSQAGRRRA